MGSGRYMELVGKFQAIQRECGSLAMEMAQERMSSDYDEDQAGWLEDVQAKLEELRDY